MADWPSAKADENPIPSWPFAEFYKYDKALPFNFKETFIRETADYTLHRWEFDGVHGKRVTAQLSLPKKGAKPFPVFLFFHSYPASKEAVKPALDPASKAGYASLSLDAEYMGERKVAGKDIYSKYKHSSRDAMVQTIVDYRRAIDLLEKRPEIDPKRIGAVGASMGGILGALAAGVEPRIRATALAVGGAEWGYLLQASVVAEFLGLNKGDDAMDPKEFRRVVAPADPVNWAQRITTRPVLMLNAKHDILVNPKAAKILFARLGGPKKIVWFDASHELPYDDALPYVFDFFDRYLKGDEDPAALGAQVLGHDTEPLNMDLGGPLPAPRTEAPLADLFDYDENLPLDVVETEAANGAAHFSFVSAHDRRVPALFVPAPSTGTPATPPILYLHEYGGDKSEAAQLDSGGAPVLAIDLMGFGERAVEGRRPVSSLIYESRDAIVQDVIDARRALDVLQSKWSAAPPMKIAAKGEYAAHIARLAAATDSRIGDLFVLPGARDDEFLADAMQASASPDYPALQAALDWKIETR